MDLYMLGFYSGMRWNTKMGYLTAGGILALGIGIYFLSAVIPGALTNFFGADTSGWDSGTVALWALIPLAIVAVLVMVFVPRSGGKGA